MERGSLSGLKRRPAEEERGGTRDAKRTCRRIDAGLGENELAQACWITDWGSESKGFIAQECLPGNLQGRQSSVIAADNGRRPTQPCSRCLAGESRKRGKCSLRMGLTVVLEISAQRACWSSKHITSCSGGDSEAGTG
ncbi:uncharacterized protein C10orf143 homolog isoform X6 [Notamacropus eugenii]|uniref:uncharacterized protein C10orf143 homolog isoform X6 n=1 Tax=Notamacropus eugenii TaxID=9315 RepID=UPI003B66B48D